MYQLNCIQVVFGEDQNHMFPVNIARTQAVGNLRKVIKEEKKPQFDRI
jgi:hypothetical protein